MAFSVQLFSFSKRENSTARPTGTAREFSCIVRTGTGILRPSIVLDIGLSESPAQYNYAYIPAFNRYYFIEEWVFEERLWQAQLSVDVLATYKTEIGAANLYVLRAAADYDGDIIDNLYPTKVGSTFQNTALSKIWSLTGGAYVTGVVNKHADFGSIKYYIFSASDFANIVSYLLSDQLMDDYDFSDTDASFELQKALIDPLQYIKSCVYIPVPIADIKAQFQNMETVSIFNWDVWKTTSTVITNIVTPSKPKLTFTNTFSIPKHPQTVSRGNYTNTKPYTNLTLLIPPFGVIEIDTTVTANATELTAIIEIDMLTGLGILTIQCNNIVLNRIEAQIGVPVQLSQVSRDYLGGAVSIASGAANAISSFASMDIAGGISSAANGIGNAIRALTPRSQTIGSGGAYAQLDIAPRLDAQFFIAVDDDLTQNGRPLCKKRTPASLGGYMLIQDGDVSTTGTADENRTIRSYLEGGFYYE